MLLFSPNWLFVYPGILLMALGLLLGSILVGGPLRVGGTTLDVHSLLFSAAFLVIGFQAVLFGVFTRVFAVTHGLLPTRSRLARAASLVTLEVGLIVGALLFLAGVAGSARALGFWSRGHFGDLDPRVTLRLVIPSVTAMIVGLQAILASFFLSVLSLAGKKPGEEP
jgi:hypothetical protein